MSDRAEQHRRMAKMRKSLFMSPEVKQLLRDMSVEFGVTESQLVSFFIVAVAAGVDKQIKSLIPRYLVESDSPAWRYNLNVEQFRIDCKL